MHEVGNLNRFPDRRSFVIGDPQDAISPYLEQTAWADKLAALGHRSLLIEAHGNGEKHHGLAAAALTAAAGCAKGLSDGEIRTQVATLNRR